MSLDAEDSVKRQEQGFDMIGLGSDGGMMIRSILQTLKQMNREAKPHSWF